MRQIKFRAWDKIWKKMYENVAEFDLFRGVSGLQIPNGGKGSHLEFMQYTGLKDKNGKEIYEGDIVDVSNFEPGIYQVGFNRGGFCFFRQESDNFYNDIKYAERGEIIGNIYENPDLIE